ncbi:MAG: metallophosphoesterase [Desulfobacteraceae bacterium]|nr:metallophosphoesterase [Desulfobacteraceae bacterium]
MDIKKENRRLWAVNRAIMESDPMRRTLTNKKLRKKFFWFGFLIKGFEVAARLSPFYQKGKKNAANPFINQVDLVFDSLPPAFDGYSILHMTDLHLDFIPEITRRICEQLRSVKVDLCVMTGDYSNRIGGDYYKDILAPMEQIVSAVQHRDGIFATLGNHDTFKMVGPFEDMGINMLINETCDIIREDSKICVTGLDDPHYYYTKEMKTALEKSDIGFKIALVHTPALYDMVRDNGYDLYLTGHTHGGQICLPGGIPLILHLDRGHKYYRGKWNYDGMTGYTGQGVGSVGIALRYYTRSEITLFTLKTRKDTGS